MCGIVGAAARRDVVSTLIGGLKALEYRGYDSAGIALLTERGLERVRTKGKVRDLEALQASQPIAGHTGIAHTRWATHGAPNTVNAHPIDSRGNVAVVHNGIIENHDALREELRALGFEFATQTDTEVVAHLIEHYQSGGVDLLDAVRQAIARLRGAYAIAVISKRDPGRVIGARRGSPMVAGLADGEQFIASDIHALLPVTRRFVYLAEGDVVDATIDRIRIYDEHGAEVERPVKEAHFGADAVERGVIARSARDQVHVARAREQVARADAENLGQDVAAAEAPLERIGDCLRLLVDFLEHVVAIFAALDCVGAEVRLLDRALHRVAVLVVYLYTVDARVGDVALGQVDEAPCDR